MKYIIDEEDLRELLYSHYKLAALEYGGVDNWEWYGESQEDYLDFIKDISNSDVDYMYPDEGFKFLIDEEIKKYRPFRQINPDDYYGFDYTEKVCK